MANISTGVAIDSAGNSFASGYTSSTGGNFLGQSTSGGFDGFVVKRNSAGTVLWTRTFGTSSPDLGMSLAVVGGTNVAVGGYTSGSFPTYTLSGPEDAVVRLYDTNGATVWTRQYGTTGYDEIRGVAADSLGHVYTTGSTTGAFSGYTAAGNLDGFVSQIDATTGAVNWTYQFGTQPNDVSYSAVADAAGNVYVTGSEVGDLLGQTWSGGGTDAFVLKLDASGSVVWARLFGGTADDEGRGIALDSTGAIYVGGHTLSTLSGQVAAGDRDAFVLKLDANGNLVWNRQFGSSAIDQVFGIGVDGNDRVILTGTTTGALPGETNAGDYDAFVRVYDSNGSEVFTDQFGSSAEDVSQGAAADANGAVYLAGYTWATLPGKTSAGSIDAFVVQTVPEPGSAALFALGLLGLAAQRRRRA